VLETKATTLLLPPSLDDFAVEVLPVEQHNVIIIGESRSGKSTFKKLLQNPQHCTSMEVFRGTERPSCETILFKLNNNRHLTVNIVDTPGFGEATAGSQQRTDASISSMISEFAKQEVAKVSLVLLAIKGAGGLNAANVEGMRKVVILLGKETATKACFLVTHFEGRTEEDEKVFMSAFVENESCKWMASVCRGGFLFTGALNDTQYKDVKVRDAFAIQQRKRVMKFFDLLGTPVSLMADHVKKARGMFAIQESVTTSCTSLRMLVTELKSTYQKAIEKRQKNQ